MSLDMRMLAVAVFVLLLNMLHSHYLVVDKITDTTSRAPNELNWRI